MKQPDFFDIPSPCIGVCRTNNRGFCVGCWRSREERHLWLKFSDEQKHQVMQLIAARKARIAVARWQQQQPEDTETRPQQGELFDDPAD